MGICWLNIKIVFHQSFPVCGRKCQTKFFKKHVSYSSGPLHPKLKGPLGVNFLKILFPAGPNIHRGSSQNPLHYTRLHCTTINYSIWNPMSLFMKNVAFEASNCFEWSKEGIYSCKLLNVLNAIILLWNSYNNNKRMRWYDMFMKKTKQQKWQ